MDEITRTCGYCCSRRPLAELGRVPGTGGFQCLDSAACQARAHAAMLYPVSERELEGALAAREAALGAVRQPAPAAPQPAPEAPAAPQPEPARRRQARQAKQKAVA